MKPAAIRHTVSALAFVALLSVTASAEAQVVSYGGLRPVVVAPAYVANYTPAGNYAAVTAFSPPLVAEPTAIAVTSAYAPVVAAPAAVITSYAPAVVAQPVVSYAPPVVAPVVAAPVTTYYAPGVLYRRGPLGVYRPVRSAYYLPY